MLRRPIESTARSGQHTARQLLNATNSFVVNSESRRRSAWLATIGSNSKYSPRKSSGFIVVAPTDVRPVDGLTVDFVVEADRAQLSEIVQRVRDGRLRTNIGKVASLDEAVATFKSTERRAGKTVIRVRP